MGRRWSRFSFLLACTAGLVVVYWLVQLQLASLVLGIGVSRGSGAGSFSGSSCSPSCGSIVSRLVLYLTGRGGAPSPGMLRREDCANDTDRLFQLLLDGSPENTKLLKLADMAIYARPAEPLVPVGVSGACLATLFPVEPATDDASSFQDSPSTGCFNRSFSESELAEMYAVLHQLAQNFSQLGLEIFLTDGSLIGSGRHFGVIPWDDDVDFMVREDQKYEVRELLTELSNHDEFRFVDTELTNQHWRLEILCRRLDAATLDSKRCRFSVDLFFGRVFGRYFLRPEWPFSFKLTDVYPLRQRPFGPYLMAGPNRPDDYLSTGYTDNYYSSCMFEIHSDRFRCERKVTACSSLRRFYPFVSRLRLRLRDRLVNADILTWRSRLHGLYIPQQ